MELKDVLNTSLKKNSISPDAILPNKSAPKIEVLVQAEKKQLQWATNHAKGATRSNKAKLIF